MKANNCFFSEDVQGYEYTPRTIIQKLLYLLLDKEQEEQYEPMLNPTKEDIKKIIARVGAISNHVISSYVTVDGILYMNLEIGGVSAEYLVPRSRDDLAHDLLVAYREYWQETREITPAPFITMLTAKALQLAVPISTQGYRTLAQIQKAQMQTSKKLLDAQADKELRKARALKNYKK